MIFPVAATVKRRPGAWIIVVLGAWSMILAGCASAPPPPRGGSAVQAVRPFVGPPAPSAAVIGESAVVQEMKQPDAPEGQSRQVLVDREVEHRADGVVVIRERHATTELGGSQDWAAIVREYGRIDLFRGVLLGIGLLFGAVVAWSRGWPLLGIVLAFGAGASLLVVWWAGIVACLGAAGLYVGWQLAKASGGGVVTP